MTNKEKKDVFLDAVKGAVEIKKDKSLIKDYLFSTTKNKRIKKQKKDQGTPNNFKEKINRISIEKEDPNYLLQEKININKKIKKGTIKINKKIDLHGLSLIDAKNTFIETVEECFGGFGVGGDRYTVEK